MSRPPAPLHSDAALLRSEPMPTPLSARVGKSKKVRNKIGWLCASLAFAGLGVEEAKSQSTWNVNANGTWNTPGNWSPAGVPVSAPGSVVNFTNQITGNRNITLDINATLGVLNIGDLSGGQNFSILGSGSNKLTFEALSGQRAQINKINDGGNDTISAGMVLNSGLDISIDDPTHGAALLLYGLIETGVGGPAPGEVAIQLDTTATNTKNQILQFGNSQNNTFTGQIVVNSGTLRSEGANSATLFGAMGVGNETIINSGGRLDLRDHDFNVNTANGATEIFRIAGTGWRNLGSLVNTTGTGVVSHVILNDDATFGGQSTIEFRGYTNTGSNTFVNAILDGGGNALTKLGSNTVILYDTVVSNLPQLNIREGEFRLNGTTTLEAGTQVYLGYNPGEFDINGVFDPTNFSQGSRTQTDLNSTTGGNAGVNEARLEFNSQKNVTHDLVINLNRGAIETGGSTTAGAGNNFNVTLNGTINMLGGGIRDNVFNMAGGADGTSNNIYEYPGRFELGATLDNTSSGNLGTGFTKRGNRELRIISDQTAFNGEVLVVQPNSRFINRGYNTTSGSVEEQYFNLALADNGTLRNASNIILERGTAITLLNTGTNVNNRINDTGIVTLRNGFLHLMTNASAANTENWGNVVSDFGTNWFMIDGRAGGKVDNSFASLDIKSGSVMKFMSLKGDSTFGSSSSDDVRLAINNTSNLDIVGNTNNAATTDRAIVYGTLGGVVPSTPAALVSPATIRPEEQLENALAWSGSGVGFMTLETINGVTYLRPLKDSEYSTTLGAGVNWNVISSNGNAGLLLNSANVTTNTTINSLRIADATARTTAQDHVYIGPNATLKIDSGMITFSTFQEATSGNRESVIRGGSGFLDMNGKVAIINSAATWHDTDAQSGTWSTYVAGNSAFMRTHMTNATGLVKTGRNSLYLDTWNDYTGKTYVSEGLLVARHNKALGLSDEVVLTGEGGLYLERGVNMSGTDLYMSGTITSSRWALYANGSQNNVWGGNVIVDGVDSSGTYQGAHRISGTNNSTLSILGDIYGAGTTITDSDYWTDPRIITTSDVTTGTRTATINMYGQFKDTVNGALDLPVYNRGNNPGVWYDRNNLMRFQLRGGNEMVLNAFQQWDSAGQIDIVNGSFRIMYDPATAGGFYTDAAVNAWYGSSTQNISTLINDSLTRTSLSANGSGTSTYNASLMLTKGGQIFNNPNLYIYNNNRDGNITIGSEHTDGIVYFGSDDETGTKQSRIVFENQGGDRDLRLYQREGGTSVYNLRFLDNGTSVNSIVSKIGQGTARLVDNSYGASSVERWNIMGGVMEWQQTQQGNNRFANGSASLTMGGGMLNYIGNSNMTASRSQTLTGQVRFLNGGSEVRVTGVNSAFNTTLTLGTNGTDVIREEGATVLFSKIANGGTVNILLNGTVKEFVLPWAVYSQNDGVVNDFAAIDGVSASVVSAGSKNEYNTGLSAQDTSQWINFNINENGWVSEVQNNGFSGLVQRTVEKPEAGVFGVRFFTKEDTAINIAEDTTLGLERGAILVATEVGANNKGIHGGSLTSYEYIGSTPNGRSSLYIHNYNPLGTFEISSKIVNNSYDEPVSLVHSGTGTTILSGVNTYTGNNYLVGGVLEISQDANLGSAAAPSMLYMNGGILSTTSTFELDANRSIILGGNGGGIQVANGTTLTYSGNLAAEGNVVDPTNGYTANIQDNPMFGDFTKLGDGTLALDGATDNTSFTGLMLIKDGVLKINSPLTGSGTLPNLLGTNQAAMDGTIIYDGATLELATGNNWTTTEWITFNGSGHLGGGALRVSLSDAGTAYTYRLNGQMIVDTDSVFSVGSGSNLYLNEAGGDLKGGGDIIRTGNSGEFRIYGNNTHWTGNLVLGSGVTWLHNETGKITATQGITLTRNAYLGLYNESTGADPYGDRVNDNAAIDMSGYSRLRMQGQSAVHSGYETFGDLNVSSGLARLQVYTARATGANGGTAAPTFSGMIFNSISRDPGSIVKMTVNENGGQFADASFGTSVFNDVGVFAIKNVDNSMLSGGDGSSGTNHSILRGFFGGGYHDRLSNANGNRDGESSAARYLMTIETAKDPFTGETLNVVRPLKASEYHNVSIGNTAQTMRVKLEEQGISADDNVAFVGRDSSLANPLITNLKNDFVTLEGDLTVNSLSVHVNSTSLYTGTSTGATGERVQFYLGEGSTLKIDSGVLNVANSQVVDKDGSAATSNSIVNEIVYFLGGDLDFNNQEAIINVGSDWIVYDQSDHLNGYASQQSGNADLYINSTITNANGLIKTGERSLILSGDNNYTGPTSIVEGNLYVRSEKALGNSDVVNVVGAGQFIVQEGVTISGVDVRAGVMTPGNRGVLILESGSGWRGDVIIDNVDVTGQAGSTGTTVNRNIVRSTTSVGFVYGDIYADPTHAILGANGTTAQMVSTQGGADGTLWLKGSFKDRESGAFGEKITELNQNEVLRFEIGASSTSTYSTSTFRSNNEMAVWVDNQWDAVGRISHEQGYLYYFGDGNFWTDAAAANMTATNIMSGYHMGGDISTTTVTNQNLALFLTKEGQKFNISDIGVGLENDLGNRTGNSTLGGVHTSGTVSFGLGTGSITFESARTGTYDRDLRLYQRAGGVTNIDFNLVDTGAGVNSSITKAGGGVVNLMGSTAGHSSVEGVNLLAGKLVMQNYGANAFRRVGQNALLRTGGGTLQMISGSSFTEQFGAVTVAAGGSTLMVNDAAVLQLTSTIGRNALGALHFQEVNGGQIRATGIAANSRLGSYATYGASTTDDIKADGWASTDGSGNIQVYTHSGGEVNTFGAGLNTDAQGAGLAGASTGSVRFNTNGSITSGNLTVTDGGILMTSNYTGTTAIGAGVGITTGSSLVDLILHNFASGPVTVAGNITGSQNVVFNGKGTTVLSGTNTFTGKTAVLGGSKVSVDTLARLGATPGATVKDSLYLNDGTVQYTGAGPETLASTRGITLGGGGGTFEFTNNGTIIYAGLISSEASPIGTYNTATSGGASPESNPLAGDLTIKGTGTFQLGADYAATNYSVANFGGLRNTYTGLTTIGDGTTKTVVQLRGQPQDDQYIWMFGTHEGLDDGTLVRNNSELRFQFQRSSNTSFDGQVRTLEWFTFGESDTDVTYMFNDTGREVEIAGNLLVKGTLMIHGQNTGVDVGNTTSNGAISLGINSGYGGQLLGDVNSRIIKTGAGTMTLRESSSGFAGTIEARRGELQLYGYGDVAGIGEKMILGDRTYDIANLGDSSIAMVQRSSGNNTDLTSERETLNLYQDIDVHGITGTTTSNNFLKAYLYTDDSAAKFHGDIHIYDRSSTTNAGLYIQLINNGHTVNPDITGRKHENYMYLNGNISGSGTGANAFIDARITDSLSTNQLAPFYGTFVLGGDNSGWSGELRVAGDNTTPGDVFERTIVRFANDKALTAANDVRMYYQSYLQAGGKNVTIGRLLQEGGNGVWDENGATSANSTITIENAAHDDGYITITENGGDVVWNAMFRDGETPTQFNDGSDVNGSLHVGKAGTATAILNQINQYTGTTTVYAGNLQVGQGGDGTRAMIDDIINNIGRTGFGDTIVKNQAILSGTGLVQGTGTTVHRVEAGGIIAPGDSGGIERGTLFIDGSLVVENGGILELQLSEAHTGSWSSALALGSTSAGYAQAITDLLNDSTVNGTDSISNGMYDHLEINGTLTLSAGSKVSIVDDGYTVNFIQAGDVFNLIDWVLANNGGFDVNTDLWLPDLDGIMDMNLGEQLMWDKSLFTSHGILMVTIVPEPSRWLLFMMAVGGLIMRRRRSRK